MKKQLISLSDIIKDRYSAISTPTFAKEKIVRDELHKRGLKWRTGTSYEISTSVLITMVIKHPKQREICLRPNLNAYDTIAYCKNIKCKIYALDQIDLTK